MKDLFSDRPTETNKRDKVPRDYSEGGNINTCGINMDNSFSNEVGPIQVVIFKRDTGVKKEHRICWLGGELFLSIGMQKNKKL